MAFKKWSGTRTSIPSITLRQSGSIYFNKPAAAALLNGEEFAVLYYDADEKKIGIEPTSEECPEARPIKNGNGSVEHPDRIGGALISCLAFFKQFEIDYSEKKVIPASEVTAEDNGMLVISLEGF